MLDYISILILFCSILMELLAGVSIVRAVEKNVFERNFLTKVFLSSFLARIIFAVFFLIEIPDLVPNNPYLSKGFFGDDGVAYDRIAFNLSANWLRIFTDFN